MIELEAIKRIEDPHKKVLKFMALLNSEVKKILPFAKPIIVGGSAVIEDLLIDRLNSAKHWNDSRDFEQSAVLITSYDDKIDWKYLEEKAKENDVFDKLEEIQIKIRNIDIGVE